MANGLVRNYDSLRQLLVSFENSEKTDKLKTELFVGLVGHQHGIWKNGLDDDLFEVLVQILLNTPLGTKFQKQILHSLVPRFRIPSSLCERMMLWFCSQVIPSHGKCGDFIKWLETMTRFNFVPSKFIDCWYDLILKFLVHSELVPSLCCFLTLAVKPKFVTKWNVQLVEMYYSKHQIEPLKSLLSVFAQHAPHLVPKRYHAYRSVSRKISIADSNFDRAIETVATKYELFEENQGVRKTENWRFIPELPGINYDMIIEGKKRVEEIGSMFELGKSLQNLQLPNNELTLIQNDYGIMTLVINGPSENFLHFLSMALMESPSPALVAQIANLQDILTYGLPPVTTYLSEFLTVWDGQMDEDIVYRLLPRLHFNSYEDLLEMILRPLARVYYICEADVKVKIIDSLVLLINNMVTVEMKRTDEERCQSFPPMDWLQQAESALSFLIDFCVDLLLKGIALEGPQCTVMVLNSVLFYQKINWLILTEEIPLFYVIHQCFSYPALYSMNHVVLNELCKLVLTPHRQIYEYFRMEKDIFTYILNKIEDRIKKQWRLFRMTYICLMVDGYKKELIPAFEAKGLLENYERQVEAVMGLADSMYKYLWEKEGEGRSEDYHTTRELFSPDTSLGIHHVGIFPFLCLVVRNLNRNPRNVKKEELLELAKTFLKNVWEFVAYEEAENCSSNTTFA